ELSRRTGRVTGRETGALVERVRPEVHHPPLAAVQIDLEGVAARVPIHPRFVALVRGGVVESGLGEGEIRWNRVSGHRSLHYQQQLEQAHRKIVRPAGSLRHPCGLLTTPRAGPILKDGPGEDQRYSAA